MCLNLLTKIVSVYTNCKAKYLAISVVFATLITLMAQQSTIGIEFVVNFLLDIALDWALLSLTQFNSVYKDFLVRSGFDAITGELFFSLFNSSSSVSKTREVLNNVSFSQFFIWMGSLVRIREGRLYQSSSAQHSIIKWNCSSIIQFKQKRRSPRTPYNKK